MFGILLVQEVWNSTSVNHLLYFLKEPLISVQFCLAGLASNCLQIVASGRQLVIMKSI